MTEFSVIVPFCGPLPAFEDTLASVLRHRPPAAQIIVPHDGSYDDPHDLQEEVEFVASDGGANLIHLVNLALRRVVGGWTVLVRPGVELDENWQQSVQALVVDSELAAIVPILVRGNQRQRMVAAGICTDHRRTRQLCGPGQPCSSLTHDGWSAIGPSSWLAVYRTVVLQAIGPIDEGLDAVYVDVDIAMAIQSLGLRTRLDPDFVATVDDEQMVVSEANVPHGRSAQRAFCRFAPTRRVGLVRHMFAELLQCPWRPWKFGHLWQRLGAKQARRSDGEFARRLARLAAEKSWLDAPANPAHRTQTSRRAA